MTRTELLALAERLGEHADLHAEHSPQDDEQRQWAHDLRGQAALLRKLAALEPVAWLSTDCIGERYLCFTKPSDLDPIAALFDINWIIDHE